MCLCHHSWVLQPGPAAAHEHRSRALRSYGALRTGCGGGFAAFEAGYRRFVGVFDL